MNKYLEKIAEMTELAEMQKEAMRVSDLANIAKKVGLRQEGDWRGLARQFADNTGALRPARERAGIRERITGIGNNAIQQVQSTQRKLRDTDEVLGIVSEKTRKIVPQNTSLSLPNGTMQNPGMGVLKPGTHKADIEVRQGKAMAHSQELVNSLRENHGKQQLVHTHPNFDTYRRLSRHSRYSEILSNSDIDPGVADMFYRRNLPSSSMGGAAIAAKSRGSLLRNKQDAHMMSKEFPKVDRSKLQDPSHPDFQDELDRVQKASEALNEKLSAPVKARFAPAMGDMNTLPQANRRNSIIGGDNTIGVHTQTLVPTGRPDISSHIPVSYQHAYFDINQGGHKAIRRMLKKGINPDDHGLNSYFMK